MADQPDYYSLLGIAPTANQAEVTTAYASLVAANAADPGRVVELTHAFQILANPEQRTAYDLSRAGTTGQPAAVPGQVVTALPGAFPTTFSQPPGTAVTVGSPAVTDLPVQPISEDTPTIARPPASPTVAPPAAASSGPERTVLVGPGAPAPITYPAQTTGEVTQRTTNVQCPVCGTENLAGFGSSGYCQDCGFLLSQAPGEGAAPVGGVRLVALDGAQEHWLHDGANTVGRQDADVLLPDATVSRLHAHLYLSGDQLSVEDANSTNGSRLNGVKLEGGQRNPVSEGAELQFGQVTLKVRGAGAVQAPSASPSDAALLDEGADAAEPPVGRLIALAGGQVYPIYSFPVSVGRRGDNAVVITDAYVSGRHAEILQEAGQTFVRDLGSTNGTMIAGEPVTEGTPVLLPPGKWVQFGKQRFQLTLVDAPADGTDKADLPGTAPVKTAAGSTNEVTVLPSDGGSAQPDAAAAQMESPAHVTKDAGDEAAAPILLER